MTEIEKLEAGLEYCYDDPEVEKRKEEAIVQCKEYNAIDDTDYDAQYAKHKEILGGVGASLSEEEPARWDREHRELLDRIAPEQFEVSHYAALKVLKKR